MQTFLPLPTFGASLAALDSRRLGKQIIESYTILCQIEGKSRHPRNHPVVRMWRPYPGALLNYGLLAYHEWQSRYPGHVHTCGEWLIARSWEDPLLPYIEPAWLGDERLHSSHRGCLLAKNPQFYARFHWGEAPTPPSPTWPYFWPL